MIVQKKTGCGSAEVSVGMLPGIKQQAYVEIVWEGG